MKAASSEKNIRKLLDNLKKRVLRKGGFLKLGKTNIFSQMEKLRAANFLRWKREKGKKSDKNMD